MPLVTGTGDGGTLLEVKVVPGASRTKVAGRMGDRLKVVVSAPPEKGRANTELLRLVAGTLGVPRRCVEIVRGGSGREKTLRISGMGPEDVLRLLT